MNRGDTERKVTERLIRYARVNTQSSPFQGVWPTTPCQMDLARMLAEELRCLGAEDVYLDEKTCVVYAGIRSSSSDAPALPRRPDRPHGHRAGRPGGKRASLGPEGV